MRAAFGARREVFETIKPAPPAKRVAMRNVVNGSIYYYAEDVLGSSRTIVQPGQTSPCYDADFYPYGGERDITVSCSPNYKFEGKERDTETNNDDFGARYYSSRFGRWLSADWSAIPVPVPYANLTNPQTLNLYAMVSDNPETFADLDGHDPPPPGTAGSGSAAGQPCVPSTSSNCPAPPPPQQQTNQQQNQGQNNSQNDNKSNGAAPLPPGANPAAQAAKYKTRPVKTDPNPAPKEPPNPTEPPPDIVPGSNSPAPIGTVPASTPEPNPLYTPVWKRIVMGALDLVDDFTKSEIGIFTTNPTCQLHAGCT